MSINIRSNIYYVLVVLCVSLWSVLCFALPYFTDTYTGDQFLGVLGKLLLVLPATYVLFYLTALNRWVFTVFLVLYDIAASIIVWGHIAYTAVMTPTLIDAAIHSNAGSTMSLVSVPMCLWFVFNGVLTALFVWYRIVRTRLQIRWWHIVTPLILLFAYYNINSNLKNIINSCYPYNLYHNFKLYLLHYQPLVKEREDWQTTNEQVPDTLDIVLVIGESCRADHLALNGYQRTTTPHLSQRNNLIALPHIHTLYTHTMASVPHILTAADSTAPERAYQQSSLVKCFTKYGFSATWISNQDRGRTYAAFIEEADTAIFPQADKSALAGAPWYESELLTPLKSVLDAQTTSRNLYVLHCVGSHWYYNNHAEPELQLFQPITDNKIITRNEPERIINSYDNTILSLDAFLDSVISLFSDRKSMVVYLADHGESLGENGHWLHATDSPPEQNPGCIVWWSENYERYFPEKIEALKENSQNNYLTDFFFHSVLSAAGISSTDSVTIKQDIFSIPEIDE